MGKKARKRPQHLGRKLRDIRDSFGLSQGLMLVKLGFPPEWRNNLSNFELDIREAPLDLVLAYAGAINVNVDILLDDERELPKALRTAAVKHREKTQRPLRKKSKT